MALLPRRGVIAAILAFKALLVPVDAIVCTQEMLKSAPVNRSLGADCGGTCNLNGFCADGFACEEPTTQLALLGTKPTGKCVRENERDPKTVDGAGLPKVKLDSVQELSSTSGPWMTPLAAVSIGCGVVGVMGITAFVTRAGLMRRRQSVSMFQRLE
mmetsp:Transcript_22642/g.51780  ORF Transcript_22642/g.51780 Transcript_22642/m.51780 type:complete len:157 (-) Transcript_22642:127-597(-)